MKQCIRNYLNLFSNQIFDRKLFLEQSLHLHRMLREKYAEASAYEGDQQAEVAIQLIHQALDQYSPAQIKSIYTKLTSPEFTHFKNILQEKLEKEPIRLQQQKSSEDTMYLLEVCNQELHQILYQTLLRLEMAIKDKLGDAEIEKSTPFQEAVAERVSKYDEKIISSFMQERAVKIKENFYQFIHSFLEDIQNERDFVGSLREFIEENDYASFEEFWTDNLNKVLEGKDKHELQALQEKITASRKAWGEYCKAQLPEKAQKEMEGKPLEEIWRFIPSRFKQPFDVTLSVIQARLEHRD